MRALKSTKMFFLFYKMAALPLYPRTSFSDGPLRDAVHNFHIFHPVHLQFRVDALFIQDEQCKTEMKIFPLFILTRKRFSGKVT